MKDLENKKEVACENLGVDKENASYSLQSSADASNFDSGREKAFIKLLKSQGIVVSAKDVTAAKLKKSPTNKENALYHNTITLLEHYRDFAWVIANLPQTISEETLDKPYRGVDTLIDDITVADNFGNRKATQRVLSATNTRLIVDLLNKSLNSLKSYPDNGKTLYNVMYYLYVIPKKMTTEDIINKLGIGRKTLYAYRKKAIHLLSMILWQATTPTSELFLNTLLIINTDSEERQEENND